ncbi:hypothetical protein INT44_006460 [Umbelopsis vinacea]|uniref:Uncharacterized protein n=1 Tax=Umbelopsis vinacea TaxID=44442 RepID=A0A8H7PSR8_9FUNG|nr:hypothetical protein INT44_006460 [Umbelopsis vinacea]
MWSWMRALRELELLNRFPTLMQVWQFLLLSEKNLLKRRQFHTLAITIGVIHAAIWKHHWQCVIEGNPWSLEAYLSTVRSQRFDLGLNFHDFDCLA